MDLIFHFRVYTTCLVQRREMDQRLGRGYLFKGPVPPSTQGQHCFYIAQLLSSYVEYGFWILHDQEAGKAQR
jgi:hypothetical protein